MTRDGIRHCDCCGQPLPRTAMLGRETMAEAEAREYGSTAETNPDGTVTIDLCLACRIQRSEARKGR